MLTVAHAGINHTAAALQKRCSPINSEFNTSQHTKNTLVSCPVVSPGPTFLLHLTRRTTSTRFAIVKYFMSFRQHIAACDMRSYVTARPCPQPMLPAASYPTHQHCSYPLLQNICISRTCISKHARAFSPWSPGRPCHGCVSSPLTPRRARPPMPPP